MNIYIYKYYYLYIYIYIYIYYIYYLMEASSQLKDTTVYEKCQNAPLQKVIKEIKDILRDILNRKEIDKKIMDYLIMKNHN